MPRLGVSTQSHVVAYEAVDGVRQIKQTMLLRLAERSPEKAGVGGSIPSLATTF